MSASNDDETLFIGAHVDLWAMGHLHYDWLTAPFSSGDLNGDDATIGQTNLHDDDYSETAKWNVVDAAHIEAAVAARQALEETSWIEKIGDAQGLPTGIVAHADLSRPVSMRRLPLKPSICGSEASARS